MHRALLLRSGGMCLNESPSGKEGKFANPVAEFDVQMTGLNESPSKEEGKVRNRGFTEHF